MNRKIKALLMLAFLYGCNAAGDKIDNEDPILIYIDKESTQCNQDGLSLIETATLLTNKGINIASSQCGVLTGINVISMCGADDLQINIHGISNADMKESLELGFKSISDLDKKGMGYKIIKCKK